MEPKDYNACVKKWADALFRFACKCTGHEEDARDIVQNSFEVLWQKKDSVDYGKAKAFLFQIVYRHSVDIYRKQHKVTIKEDLTDDRHVHQPNTELKRVLERALEQLDEQSKALVLLKDYEGYKYEEIAKITELTESQVKVYLHRARKKLKNYLVSVENVI